MSLPEQKETPERHSVIFALVRSGSIELEQRLELDKWFGLTIIPGGHIEEGETQEESMLREVREEYGSDVRPLKYKRLGSIIDGDGGRLHVKHVFIVSEWLGELSNPEGRNKHIQASLADAKRLCVHPISQKVLTMIGEELSRQNQ